ncbi:hypothetical protein C5C66_01770 [Rathayibacter toxicus]|uniref:Uncharacterized protein n=1 Tax=Rathayibacter toxicus TaxID=145458 RepID=A0A0C5BDQ3_9MICO|nr:hypothetical protein TI83_01965 [Rathayibacter toxicus]ALS57118.1 hypothetical protein APU90_04520 [Rathayibacter toxicus]KKM46070.1 hypothetical protein VT73_02975 [Rathayibacter toxicus]PPG23004.1 hypothetical protein C5D15_01745 [Rathayibacter toxicus]PPG47586.1 hypothetical protein C5D16_01740 [Rathayibacter toxicus]
MRNSRPQWCLLHGATHTHELSVAFRPKSEFAIFTSNPAKLLVHTDHRRGGFQRRIGRGGVDANKGSIPGRAQSNAPVTRFVDREGFPLSDNRRRCCERCSVPIRPRDYVFAVPC